MLHHNMHNSYSHIGSRLALTRFYTSIIYYHYLTMESIETVFFVFVGKIHIVDNRVDDIHIPISSELLLLDGSIIINIRRKYNVK